MRKRSFNILLFPTEMIIKQHSYMITNLCRTFKYMMQNILAQAELLF